MYLAQGLKMEILMIKEATTEKVKHYQQHVSHYIDTTTTLRMVMQKYKYTYYTFSLLMPRT